MNNSIASRLNQLHGEIVAAEKRAGRKPGSVNLLAVSKGQAVSVIREAVVAGQWAFGENYLQEAMEKIFLLSDLPIEWHFLGGIQANKTRLLAEHFNWVHSISRYKIAQRLNEQRPRTLPPLNVCLQVNIHHDPGQSGVEAREVLSLARAVILLPRLRLRGLMALSPKTLDFSQQCNFFRSLRMLSEQLQRRLKNDATLTNQNLVGELDSLSMGMSGDFVAAITEGATIVRVGTGVFGKRVT